MDSENQKKVVIVRYKHGRRYRITNRIATIQEVTTGITGTIITEITDHKEMIENKGEEVKNPPGAPRQSVPSVSSYETKM